MTLLVERV